MPPKPHKPLSKRQSVKESDGEEADDALKKKD
jgi:hypothetical protein